MMTQDDYKLWTGQTVNIENEDWQRLVDVASGRLASFLCLEELPEVEEKLPDDLSQLLANFMATVMAHQGNDTQVEEKRIRNFTIRFTNNSAANAFANLYRSYGDIVDKYSNCAPALAVEKSERDCCGYFSGSTVCDCD